MADRNQGFGTELGRHPVLLFLPETMITLMLVLWVYCILDVIATDEILVRNLPKGGWLIIVIVLPDIGSLAWLLLGRPMYAGWRIGGSYGQPEHRRPPAPRVRRPLATEDDPRWAADAHRDTQQRLQAWEDDLRRREAALGDGPATSAGGAAEGDDDERGGGSIPFRW